MSQEQKNKEVEPIKLILLIIAVFTWFIGALLYLIITKPKGMELIVCILACFIPVIPAVFLFLNAFGIIKLN